MYSAKGQDSSVGGGAGVICLGVVHVKGGVQVRVHCGMKTLHQVSLKPLDLERNLTSSFLALSDKLVFVVHLLLASVHFLPPILRYDVVKPASYVIVRLRSQMTLQCSQPNRKLNLSMIGCRTTV